MTIPEQITLAAMFYFGQVFAYCRCSHEEQFYSFGVFPISDKLLKF